MRASAFGCGATLEGRRNASWLDCVHCARCRRRCSRNCGDFFHRTARERTPMGMEVVMHLGIVAGLAGVIVLASGCSGKENIGFRADPLTSPTCNDNIDSAIMKTICIVDDQGAGYHLNLDESSSSSSAPLI